MRQNTSIIRRNGLTTVEIIVSITISAIVIIGLTPILANFFNSLQDLIGRTKQTNDIYSAVHSIQKDILYSTAFLRFSSLDDSEELTENLRWRGSNTYRKYVWDFRGQGPEKRNLILQKALSRKGAGNSSDHITRGEQFSESCTKDYASPVFHNVIYYLDGTTLYRRTLAPTYYSQIGDVPGDDYDGFNHDKRAAWCRYIREAKQKKSSRKGGYGEEKDIEVLKNVELFSVEYFDKPAAQNPTDYYSLPNNDGQDSRTRSATRRLIYLPNHPKDVRITIRTKKTINNKDSLLTISTRGALPW